MNPLESSVRDCDKKDCPSFGTKLVNIVFINTVDW